jgi:hypothetical protein
MGIAISSLDPFIIQSIADHGCDVELMGARSACKRLRRAVRVPKRRTIRKLLKYGAEHKSIVAWNLALEKYNVEPIYRSTSLFADTNAFLVTSAHVWLRVFTDIRSICRKHVTI